MTKPVCQGFFKKYLDSAARGNGEAAILKIWSTELGVGIFILISRFHRCRSQGGIQNGGNSSSGSRTTPKCRKFYPFYATRTCENTARPLR